VCKPVFEGLVYPKPFVKGHYSRMLRFPTDNDDLKHVGSSLHAKMNTREGWNLLKMPVQGTTRCEVSTEISLGTVLDCVQGSDPFESQDTAAFGIGMSGISMAHKHITIHLCYENLVLYCNSLPLGHVPETFDCCSATTMRMWATQV
jgi:hypothetical protein